MPTSGSIDFQLSRDDVIKLALRRINAIGQGETPDATTVTEASVALNALVKAWQADGMPLWKVRTDSFTPTATPSFNIAVGGTINDVPPLKVFRMWYRETSTGQDTPLELITEDEYHEIGDKTESGTPARAFYKTPGTMTGGSGDDMQGTFYLHPAPDAAFVAAYTIHWWGQLPFEDFDAASDYPDFPSSWTNALAWGLAEQLMYEYGVPPDLAKGVTVMAMREKQQALSFGSEEGSMFIMPSRLYLNSWE